MYGQKCPITKLWLVPLHQRKQLRLTNKNNHTSTTQQINNIQQTKNQKQLIQYLHQCLFSPTKSTLVQAIKNNQLLGFPGLTAQAVIRDLPDSTATIKGHLHRQRKNLRSTRKRPQVDKNSTQSTDDVNPPSEKDAACEIFCCAALANTIEGTLYTDLTGRFPVRSYKGNQHIFLAYVYDANAILVRAMKDRTTESMLEAFKSVYDYLIRKNYKPKLHVMDNECSKIIKTFIENDNNVTLQFVEPHEHRVNAAKRSIQTFKNHFVAGLCTVNELFPMQLWCELLQQAEISINLLRSSRKNPKLSAYALLEGEFNFNRTPLAPPGTKALVFSDPDTRASWETHAKDAWYVGPALNHYRCFRFWMPKTRAFQIAKTAKFFPTYSTIPTITHEDNLVMAAQEFIKALQQQNIKNQNTFAPLKQNALKQLSDIFNEATGVQKVTDVPSNTSAPIITAPPRVEKSNTSAPRVGQNNQPTGSCDATTPDNIRNKRYVHQRKTRRNTPMETIHEVDSAPEQLLNTTNNVPPINDTPKTTTTPRQSPRHNDKQKTTTTPRRSPRLQNTINGPLQISKSAFHQFLGNALETQHTFFFPRRLLPEQPKNKKPFDITDVCNGVVHPVTGETITKYKTLAKDAVTKPVWEEAMCTELGRLSQGYGSTTGTDTIKFMDHNMIDNIPSDRTVTYTRIVVDFRPHKADPNRVRITAGGNLIVYPEELTTRTADLITTKIMWNSVLSTPGARYMCIDIKNMYLATPLDRYEYMKMPVDLIPPNIMNLYNLHDKVKNGFVYMKIQRGLYGLPQSGILANKLLRERLKPHGYYELPHTPELWKHVTLPVQFTLVVDDFGVKYTGKENIQHLINALKETYEISEDWDGALYCGISLN